MATPGIELLRMDVETGAVDVWVFERDPASDRDSLGADGGVCRELRPDELEFDLVSGDPARFQLEPFIEFPTGAAAEAADEQIDEFIQRYQRAYL